MTEPIKRRILHKLSLSEISCVDNPCQEHARMTIMKRAVDEIETVADLRKAITALGDAADYETQRRHIIRCAKALTATDVLPVEWRGPELRKLKAKIAVLAMGVTKFVKGTFVESENLDRTLHINRRFGRKKRPTVTPDGL